MPRRGGIPYLKIDEKKEGKEESCCYKMQDQKFKIGYQGWLAEEEQTG